MLEVQRMLREGEVTLEDLALPPYSIQSRASEDGRLVSLKYSAIHSDTTLLPVRESRGLVLDAEDGWRVRSYSFEKFFNFREPWRHDVDWASARVYEKLDGSMIGVYRHPDGRWACNTTGSPEGRSEVQPGAAALARRPEWAGRDVTFAGLFWSLFKEAYGDPDALLDPRFCYTFELCTGLNQIVVRHDRWRAPLIGLRLMDEDEGFPEFHVDDQARWPVDLSAFERPRTYPLHDPASAEAFVERLPGLEEGVVVCDKDFRRVKLKSADYVAAHKVAGGVLQRKYGLVEVVMAGVADDVRAAFPELGPAISEIERAIKSRARTFEEEFSRLGGDGTDPQDPEERKAFALRVKDRAEEPGAMFHLLRGGDAAEYVVEANRQSPDVARVASRIGVG